MSTLPTSGEVIAGKYRIEGSLGEGGMAHVFAAHHELLDKPIAVKILSPLAAETANFRNLVERFLTEARAAAKVESAHVARVMDVGTLDNGLPYMVMERLDGCDLEELLRLEHHIAVSDTVDYMLQALQGLAHAHALGIVHRDLKPANLFLAHQPDGTAVIKIVDFGIAKLIDPTTGTGRITGDNSAVGSPMYMSPEQVRSSKTVDHRADIWAMGVVLYELLTGSSPFGDDDLGVGEIFAAVLEKKLPPVREKRPEVPAGLEAAVMKCLERDLDKRYADVSQLARDIAPFGSGKWTHLIEGIEHAFRRRLARMSGQTPGLEFMPVLPKRSGVKTETSATLDDLRPAPPARRSRWIWIGGALAVLAAGVGWGAHKHAFDGVVAGAKARWNPPAPAAVPPPVLPEPTQIVSAAPSISASVAAVPTTAPTTAPTTSASAQAKKTATQPKTIKAPAGTTASTTRKRPSVLDSAD